MAKVGRITAGMVLIAAGGSVALDKIAGTNFTALLINWWPLLIIMLGLEKLWRQKNRENSDQPMKLDIGGLLFAVVVSVIIIIGAQALDSWKSWGGSRGAIDAWGDSHSVDKAMIEVAIDSDVEKIKIINRNGRVLLKSGDVKQITAAMTVQVNGTSSEKAQNIADAAKLQWEMNGSVLEFETHTPDAANRWFGIGQSSIHLTMTFPADQPMDYSIEVRNGMISAEALTVLDNFEAVTINGNVLAADMQGRLMLKSTNGKAESYRTAGDLMLKTTNGAVHAEDHRGDASISSVNGAVQLLHVTGEAEAVTTNGKVSATGMEGAVTAKTTNGSIELGGPVVGGAWSLRTVNGSIQLMLPQQGDFQLMGNAKGLELEGDFPFTVQDGELSGKMGSGKHAIDVSTRGTLTVRRDTN